MVDRKGLGGLTNSNGACALLSRPRSCLEAQLCSTVPVRVPQYNHNRSDSTLLQNGCHRDDFRSKLPSISAIQQRALQSLIPNLSCVPAHLTDQSDSDQDGHGKNEPFYADVIPTLWTFILTLVGLCHPSL